MTENQKNAGDGWVMLNTKVPPHIGQLFDLLARQRGMSSFELLQLLVNGFISAAKHDGPMTPELRLLLDSLKLDVAFNKAFNFANPTAQNEIAQIVLILQQPGKHGFGMTMIDRPYMGECNVTYCIDSILERVAEVSMGNLYTEIRQVGISLDSNSLRETLTMMCNSQKIINLDEEERDELPGLGNFHDFGKEIEYGKMYKRHNHRTPDSVANQQQRIIFDDEDREIADCEAQDWEGEHYDELPRERDLGEIVDESLGCRPFDQES